MEEEEHSKNEIQIQFKYVTQKNGPNSVSHVHSAGNIKALIGDQEIEFSRNFMNLFPEEKFKFLLQDIDIIKELRLDFGEFNETILKNFLELDELIKKEWGIACNMNKNERLIEVAKRGFPGALKNLKDHGANVDAKDPEGNTALIWASKYGHKEVVQILIGYEATINEQNNEK